MLKFVSLLLFSCGVLLSSAFAQNQPSVPNAVTNVLPNETQWEYVLIKLSRGNGYDDSQATDETLANLEFSPAKIDANRKFGFTVNTGTSYFSQLSESFTTQAALDSLGKAGWELVAVIPAASNEQDSAVLSSRLIFKRRFNEERSRREAEQRKLKETQTAGKTPVQAAAKKIEFVDLDRVEAVSNQKAVEDKAKARLEQSLKNIKEAVITKIETSARYDQSSEPATQATVFVNGTQTLLKDGNKYRASEAQKYVRQVATIIFERLGLRKADNMSDFFMLHSGFASYPAKVQVRVRIQLNAGEQTIEVANGTLFGNWVDVVVNK